MFLREGDTPFAALVILCAIALTRGTGNEQCQSLVTLDSCQPWGNCSGLQCPKASFVVYKCQDPVVVQLTVNNNTLRLTESSEVQLDDSHSSVKVSLLRDDNNLFLNATEKDMLIIPNVVIPLNTRDCMCRSLQQLSSDVQRSIPQLSCSTVARCTGVRCSVPASLYGADVAVLPCRDPPGLRISLADAQGRQVYSGVFDRSQNASVSSLLMLNVAIVQRKYSMDVQVSASSPLYGTFSVFPKRTIILDKSNCSVIVTPPASSTLTCQALQNLQSGLPACYLNQACNGLNCAVLGLPYTVSFEVEPCTQPASILVTVRDATGAVLYNTSINDTTILPLGPNTALSVVVRQLPNALGLKVDLVVQSRTVNIIPFYTIPINRSECSPRGSESGTPSTLPQAANTCDAFNMLSATTQSCVTDERCDGVTCSLLGYKTSITTLPCNSPPAVTVVAMDSNDTVLFSRTVDHTQQIPLVGGATLLVTVNQLTEAIGVEVDLQTPLGTMNVIPYIVIPLNTTNCSHAHTTPPSLPGTTCNALTNLTLTQPSCSTNVACDEIDCSVQGYTTAMAVLPCNSPPTIRVTVNDSNGTTLFSQTLSRSRQIPLLGGTVTLLVTVDQLDSALGVRLDLSTLFGTGTIIPYTVIPINTSNCSSTTQTPPTSPPDVATTCAALSSITSSNPTCLTNVACDSLTCTAFGLSTGFTVLPCNAPPAIAVSVSDSNGTSLFSQTLSQSRLVPLFGGALTLVITVDQLSNSLGLKVDVVSVFGGSVNLIPYTVIPLNTSNCGPTGATPTMTTQTNTTCSALRGISAMGQGCSVTPSCNEVDCILLGYSMGFIVLPCNTPPAIGIIVNDTRNTTLFYQVISRSQQISLFGLTALDVTVVQLGNAIGLKVDVIPLPGSRINVIPYTVIPLNTSNCGPTGAPPTSFPPTNTCGALSTIAVANQACSPTTNCQEVDCSYLNYTIAVAVLPCSTPPGVMLSVLDPRGMALVSQVLTRSQNVTIVGGVVFLQAKVDQLNGSLGVKVDAISPLGVVNIIPYTVIPLNTSNCTYNPTQASPTATPPDTCSALGEIAASVQSCIVTPTCDGVDCPYSSYRLGMRLLPCEVPPSIRLWSYDQTTGKVLYNQTVSQSQQLPITSFANLDVTMVQMPNAIGLTVDLVSPLSRTNLIPLTVIPISTAGCNGTARPGSVSWSVHTSPSPVSLNPTASAAEQGLHIGVIVGVPLGVVITLLLASALAVVGMALRRHYRKMKARSYRLMEMTDAMTNLDAESD